MKIHRRELSARKGNAVVMPGAGNGVLVAIGVAPEGRLAKYFVKQVVPGTVTPSQGTAPAGSVAFKVDVLDSLPPGYSYGLAAGNYPTSGQAIDAGAISPPANMEIYRVIGQATATAGNPVVDYASGEDGYTFRNGDNASSTNANRLIYILITPTTSAPLSLWEVLVLVQSDVG